MENKLHILLCEDEESLGMLVREYLQAKGYDAELYLDGEAGYKAFMRTKFDMCLLDVMMPKMDGFTLAREIRMVNAEVPIIFLTAKNLKDDILEGFKLGADVKVKTTRAVTQYQLGKFTFDTQRQILSIGDKQTKLTTKECELLTMLCAHSNDVLERELALKTIWIDDNYFNARSMDVYITKLRKHLKDDPSIEINNVHGKGYRLIVPNLMAE